MWWSTDAPPAVGLRVKSQLAHPPGLWGLCPIATFVAWAFTSPAGRLLGQCNVTPDRRRSPCLPAAERWRTLPGGLLAGAGTGLFNPAASAVALSSVPEQHSGLASGINDTFRQTGIPLGVAVYGALVPAAAAVGHG